MTAKHLPAVAAYLLIVAACAAESTDYGSELPRIAPVEPKQALDLFTIAAGYHIELVAHEPTVTDPVAMDFDEHEQLFVVEMRGYSEHATDNLGQVRLLTDPDGDGQFDQSTVYVDGLSWPTALICYDGGVFVGAAPDIYYCKDTDGDGVADLRKKVFTGFGTSNVQGLLNSFRWGLDNRIHGATSSSGGVVRRMDQAESEAIVLRGRDFSFDPRTLELRPESGGGQHGMCFDQWGRKFVCANSDHLQAVLIPDRYVANNPYYALPNARESIATDGPQAAVFRTSPVEPWRIVRTRLRVAGDVPGPVEGGGTAAGYFTSATGVTIFDGGDFGGADETVAVIGDVGSNIVHRKRLTANGVSFSGERIDVETEFLSSRDIWFRPVQFAHGPRDGIYVADMYREVIEHPDSLAPIIKKHLDLDSGRDRGRIYRIVKSNVGDVERVIPGNASNSQLVAMLAAPNASYRRTASRLLVERSDLSVVDTLRAVVLDVAQAPIGRVHAAFVLRSMNRLSADVAISLLTDANPRVRECGLDLAEALPLEGELRAAIASMAGDDDTRVRFQLALTLSNWSGERNRLSANWKDVTLSRLMKDAGDDAWLQAACLVAAADFVDFGDGDVTSITNFSRDLAKSLETIIEERERDDWRAITVRGSLATLTTAAPVRHLPVNQDVIDRYSESLDDSGSVENGQRLFAEHCGTCHAQRSSETSLGPLVSALRARGPAGIVANVLDPNREVHPQFVDYTAETDDGQLINGVIVSDTATSVTLARDIKQQSTLLKSHIETLRSNGKSIMPEGFEKKLSDSQMNDLVAFILQAN